MLKNTTHTNNVVDQFNSSSSKKADGAKKKTRTNVRARARTTSAPELGTTRDTTQRGPSASCTPRAQARLMQQRHISDEFQNPRQHAHIRRQCDVHLLAAERGVGCGLAHVNDVERESKRYAVRGCYLPLRNGTLVAFWKSWRMARVRSARQPGSVCCRSPCKSDTVVVKSLSRLILVVGGNFYRKVPRREHTYRLHQLKMPFPTLNIERR